MSGYIMDQPIEGDRIEAKTDRALTAEQLRWAGLSTGMTAADIGCAAGTTTRMMAEIIGPTGRAIGIDSSVDRIEQARAFGFSGPTEYRVADATALGLEDSSVDLCWSRFLFEYLPDPRRALREMARITRPGGIIAVSDLDGNCVWHSSDDPELNGDIQRALTSLSPGFDPMVGRKLLGWMHECGLREIAVDLRPYNVVAGTIARPAMEHWRLKLGGVSAALRDRGWSASEAADLVRRYERMLKDPAVLSYSVLITVRGLV